MSIKIQSNINDKQLHNMRCLMVDNVEKFRVVIDNKIVYGKGKINFDFNWPKDGNGESFENYYAGSQIVRYIPIYPTYSLYVFYGEGFFKKRNSSNDAFYKYDIQNLSDLIKNIYDLRNLPLDFKGWYTAKTGGYKIDTLADVQSSVKTNLFNYRDKDGLPEITLYAQWDVHKYTIKVHNIIRGQGGFSSFYNKETKKTTTDSVTIFRNILHGTKIGTFLNDKISNVKYSTWAYNIISSNPQKFLGWSEKQYEYQGLTNFQISNYAGITKNMDIYPHFEILMVFKKVGLPSGTFYFDRNNYKIPTTQTGGGYLLKKEASNSSAIASNSPYPEKAGHPPEFFRYTKSNGRYTGHYRYIWGIETKDYYTPKSNDSDANPWHDISLSSTIVYTIKSVTPYWWQLEGYY